MIGKYPVITLCVSTRFKDQFLEAQKRLTLAGKIVINVSRTTAQALEGVGRFVIGLAADVKVVEGKKLLDYIKKYDKKHIQKLA